MQQEGSPSLLGSQLATGSLGDDVTFGTHPAPRWLCPVVYRSRGGRARRGLLALAKSEQNDARGSYWPAVVDHGRCSLRMDNGSRS